MNLIERIFRRRRLAYLEAQNRLLMDMNENLVTGDSVRLTMGERRMIVDAIESPPYKDRVELPQTRKHIRAVRNSLREKIKASLREPKAC